MMKYSPLAVHCTSLCLDVVSRSDFAQLSERDIKAFYPDVYQMVFERLQEQRPQYSDVELLTTCVTRKVLAVLCYLNDHPESIDSGQILYVLDEIIRLPSDPHNPH
jgi:hypothetical protein